MYVGALQEIRWKVSEMLPLTRRAFGEAAEQLSDIAGALGRQADFIEQEIREAENPDVREPVVQVLLARHYKRIGVHLSNICTAATSPVDLLGYHVRGTCGQPPH